jgi:hypothetical protein
VLGSSLLLASKQGVSMSGRSAAATRQRGLGLPDYRLTDVAEKYIRRGLCLLCKHAPAALLLVPIAGIGVSSAVLQ